MKNIANYISISRIIMSILLIITKTFSIPFYIIYIYSGLSDMVDGFVARKYNITSEIGAKIDSIADIVFILVAIVKICNIICGYVYYKKLTLPHTIMNKITGFILFIAPLIIQCIDLMIVEILICILATFSAIQEGHYIRTRKV